MREDPFDLSGVVAGDARAWERFVARYARVIYAAVYRRLAAAGRTEATDDVAQEVFVRLLKADRKLLRGYDPARAALSTWLTVIATSAAIDHLRRPAPETTALEAVPEERLAVEDKVVEKLDIPPGLLSPRQALVLELLYRRELEVAEAARVMGVSAQTVRSTHHKAIARLRAHFRAEEA